MEVNLRICKRGGADGVCVGGCPCDGVVRAVVLCVESSADTASTSGTWLQLPSPEQRARGGCRGNMVCVGAGGGVTGSGGGVTETSTTGTTALVT